MCVFLVQCVNTNTDPRKVSNSLLKTITVGSQDSVHVYAVKRSERPISVKRSERPISVKRSERPISVKQNEISISSIEPVSLIKCNGYNAVLNISTQFLGICFLLLLHTTKKASRRMAPLVQRDTHCGGLVLIAGQSAALHFQPAAFLFHSSLCISHHHQR